eukprot:863228-Pyramimonas_sp.AAC.1
MQARARTAFHTAASATHLRANVACHAGKCRAYSRGRSAAQSGIGELGQDACRRDKAPPDRGINFLGAPLGPQ